MATQQARYAFSVEEWHRMGQAGLFDKDTRVELVEGEILEMAPIGDRHAVCVMRLVRLFGQHSERAVLSVQSPLVLAERSEPQPDISLLRPPLERYSGHPRAEDVLLVVEVSDTSLAYDRDRKAPLYGRSE
ncbi:MAG: Uma2 family endonuclease [Acidimicrobiales bacterium]